MKDLSRIIDETYQEILSINDKGHLASYIPELENVNPDQFGVHISTINGFNYGIGNYNVKFSIQSIIKVLSLSLAYNILGEKIWNRLGVEPSGTSYNSLIQLELEKGIPRNPFINAGAIVIADILLSHLDQPKDEFIDFVRGLSDDKDLNYSTRISDSEKSQGHRNVALCNFMKSFGNIENDPQDVLDFYFDLCSIEMTCQQLSDTFLYLANNGNKATDDTPILTKSKSKRINAIMQTCGFYDESGEFTFKVGLPGKSGVGGGIIAIHPNQYAIAVWSPKLNPKGNSNKGMKFLEAFTTKSEKSIF